MNRMAIIAAQVTQFPRPLAVALKVYVVIATAIVRQGSSVAGAQVLLRGFVVRTVKYVLNRKACLVMAAGDSGLPPALRA